MFIFQWRFLCRSRRDFLNFLRSRKCDWRSRYHPHSHTCRVHFLNHRDHLAVAQRVGYNASRCDLLWFVLIRRRLFGVHFRCVTCKEWSARMSISWLILLYTLSTKSLVSPTWAWPGWKWCWLIIDVTPYVRNLGYHRIQWMESLGQVIH